MRTYRRNRSNPFRACNSACADGFRTDRAHGAIYSAVHLPPESPLRQSEARTWVTWERWSVLSNACAYCRAQVVRPVRGRLAPSVSMHTHTL